MTQPYVLVIGLGNPLREDDGVGAETVQIIDKKILPALRERVTLRIEHQIDIVQAALIKDYDHVFFVDALAGGGKQPVQIKKMAPVYETPTFTSHIGSIPALLAITARVYGQVPDCYLVAVQGSNFAFGQKLSTKSKNNATRGARTIIDLINKLLPLG